MISPKTCLAKRGLPAAQCTITGLLMLALVVLPIASLAQSARLYRVGIVFHGGPHSATVDGLRNGLVELGLHEGKQFVLSARDGKGDLKAVETAARRLEMEGVDLIVAMTTSVTLATKRATKSVPIVFYAGTDPVSAGLVESLRKPGGRLTGIHGQSAGLSAKRLELLKAMIPTANRVVTFYSPDNPSAQQSVKSARDAARQLNLALVERSVASIEELREGLRRLRPGEVDALLYVADSMVASQTMLIVESAKVIGLPTMLQERGGVTMGALAGYGESFYVIGRHSAKHVQRILLGADPRELPVEQINRFHFVINLKTAKALDLKIPPSVLARADEVIQ